MATQFETEYVEDFLEALNDIGIDVTLTEIQGSTFDTATQDRIGGSSTDFTVLAFPPYAIEHEEAEVSGLEIGDIKLVMKGPLPFESINNQIVLAFNSFKYTLVRNMPLFPGDAAAGFELVFRKGPD